MEAAYTIQGSCEITCDSCTLESLRVGLPRCGELDQDTVRRLRALDRLVGATSIETLFDEARYAAGHYSTRYPYNPRNVKVRDLLHELVYRLNDDDYSNHGEYCGGCNTELSEAWYTCEYCDQGAYSSDFRFASDHPEGNRDTGDGGPTVPYCAQCEDEQDTRAVLLDNDGRGFRLSYHDGIYRAGCRRFTMAEALRHWGNPHHDDPTAAGRLYNAVLCHAAHLALPNLK